MSVVMEEEIKRWTAKRKGALEIEILQGKATVLKPSRDGWAIFSVEVCGRRRQTRHRGR